MILYGISNCDTVRKARRWLDENEFEYSFHDFRKNGLNAGLVARLETATGWDKMLNRRSTSWRQLDEAERLNMTGDKARQLMQEHPTLIKRPVLDTGSRMILGFSPALYNSELADE